MLLLLTANLSGGWWNCAGTFGNPLQEAHDAEILTLSFGTVDVVTGDNRNMNVLLLASGGRDRLVHIYDARRLWSTLVWYLIVKKFWNSPKIFFVSKSTQSTMKEKFIWSAHPLFLNCYWIKSSPSFLLLGVVLKSSWDIWWYKENIGAFFPVQL